MLSVETFQRDQKGAIFLNPTCNGVGGGLLVPAQADNPVVIPAATGTTWGKIDVMMEAPTDIYQQVLSLMSGTPSPNRSVDAWKYVGVNILDGTHADRALMNRHISAPLVFGTQQNPFLLDPLYTEPLFMTPQQILTWQFQNASASELTVAIAAEATRAKGMAAQQDDLFNTTINECFRRAQQLSPYWLTCETDITSMRGVPGITLAANESVPVVFFNRRADITLMLTTVLATTSTPQSPSELVAEYQIRTPDYDERCSNQAVVFNCGAAEATFPHRLHTPLIIEPKDQFVVQMTNLVAESIDVFFTFFGVAIYNNPAIPGRWDMAGQYQQVSAGTQYGNL